ncbi:hypothetical protein [uncultured Actinomyces sp.]|uniref:hypothetical protein n=1 Tax=uncultured Actinomyces sp. TaxID=249061 RepID=UPI00288ADB35|nr:hypothetical protein [uncultured Actinomyces sp.]
MSEHDATTITVREMERLLRAAAQIGRFLADRRRIALRRAQEASQDRARAVHETTERQRRLAAPIWARALDDRFWARAQIEEAAYVYGMAVRFAPVDPSAQAAARRCEAEVAARWGARPRGGSEPVDGARVAPAAAFAVAPALPGEEERDWARTLDESARAERATPAPAADPEAERAETEQAPPDPEMEETAPPDLEAEQAETEQAPPDLEAERAGAWEWFNAHYSDPKVLGEYASEPERRRNALALYSALAAEGYDLDDPPEIRPITGRSATTADETEATAGYRQQLSDWLGVDASRADAVDPRAAGPMMAAWRAEADGAYPNLGEWTFHVYDKGAQAAGQVAPVRLVGRDPAPGLYTPLMLRAAADEAARAGLPPEVYLDHLQPIQRRGLLAAHTGATTGYEDALERASQYRVAYAQASAAQRPDWSKRGGPAPTRATAQRPAPADRPTAGRPAAPTGVRAPGPGGPGGRAPAWDSPAARDAWAARMIAAGIDPAAVRAARTGDQALHEPAHRATRPAARRTAGDGRPRARSASPTDTARL